MKQRMATNPCHARSVRPDLSWLLFTLSGRSCSPSLHLVLLSFPTLSRKRGAEGNAIRVAGNVVVVRAAGVDVVEVARIVGLSQPPVVRGMYRT